MVDPKDEFYVGYLPRAPKGTGSRVRLAVAALLALAAAVALLLVAAQGRFAPSVFEFGVSTELTGLISERPYPTLLARRPGRTTEGTRWSAYYLSAPGKIGAGELVAGFHGEPVRLRGSLIYRDDREMIEVEPGSVERLAGPEADALRALGLPAAEDLGRRTVVGEIVDSKCFLGVMKPGNLKPHRGCAARCISGGIPPVLVATDAQGRATYYLLVSGDGQAINREVLGLVAEPVQITGRVVRHGELLALEADPATYRRLSR